MEKKTVVIIGAGPAGLTAAYELLTKSRDFCPVILEAAVYRKPLFTTATAWISAATVFFPKTNE